MLILRGVIMLIAGVVAWLSSVATVATLAVLFGAFALLDGGFALAMVFMTKNPARWTTTLWGEAMLSVGAGALMLVWRSPQPTTVAMIVGAWALVSGVLDIAAAYRVDGDASARSLLGIAGGISAAIGLLFIVDGGSRLFLLLVAVCAFTFGASMTFIGLRLHRDPPIAATAIP